MFGNLLKGLGVLFLFIVVVGYLSGKDNQAVIRSVIAKNSQENSDPSSTNQSASTINIQDVLDAPRDAPPPSLPERDNTGYQAECSQEWTKRGITDQNMFNYCVNQQNEGYDKLVALANKFSGYRWLQAVIDGALAEWTKRGARDDNEAAYIIDQQTDNFLTLQYMSNQGQFNASVATSCLEQWTKNGDPDWSETLYCYNTTLGQG